MSAGLKGIAGGQPSMTAPRAGPCDSPQVVTENKRPKLLPAKLALHFENELALFDLFNEKIMYSTTIRKKSRRLSFTAGLS